MKASQYILGRSDSKREFDRGRPFTVSVVGKRTHRYYTGPVTNDPRDAKPSVLYRIRVKPKRIRGDIKPGYYWVKRFHHSYAPEIAHLTVHKGWYYGFHEKGSPPHAIYSKLGKF